MITNINPNNYEEIKYCVDESTILLLIETSGAPKDADPLMVARNVFLIRNNNVVWQITANDDQKGWPFMEIDKDRDGQFWGYKANEYMYLIDMKTGRASQEYYLRFESVPNLLNIKPISIEKPEEE